MNDKIPTIGTMIFLSNDQRSLNYSSQIKASLTTIRLRKLDSSGFILNMHLPNIQYNVKDHFVSD
ncbi:hypothetical protein V1478_014702 [Vespula squamosa]|uniref:Uncharacterized protein n=1 Tax=Vespula squamosa TaxID=30214 RepID=A0ABD2A2Z7_VESSQ